MDEVTEFEAQKDQLYDKYGEQIKALFNSFLSEKADLVCPLCDRHEDCPRLWKAVDFFAYEAALAGFFDSIRDKKEESGTSAALCLMAPLMASKRLAIELQKIAADRQEWQPLVAGALKSLCDEAQELKTCLEGGCMGRRPNSGSGQRLTKP